MCIKECPPSFLTHKAERLPCVQYSRFWHCMGLPSETQLTAEGHTQQADTASWWLYSGTSMELQRNHFLHSSDLAGLQRMPFSTLGPCEHIILMTSTVVRGKQELQQQECRNNSRMAICYCEGCRRGNSSQPCWESHNGQELYLLAKSTTVWVITLVLSRNAKGDFLLKFWPAAKKGPGSHIHAVCHGQSAPPQPTTNLSRSYNCRETSIPSPHHLKLSSHWKRKTVGNILGLNYVCPHLY